jgi:NAD dependent epimerase/dehydratase family enzyme
VNACAPDPVRNSEFVAALGRAMHRPAIVPMPEAVVRAVFGEMGEETLLTSQRAVPEKLLASGFRFLHPTIDEALASALRHS